jgi:hypothetical protein
MNELPCPHCGKLINPAALLRSKSTRAIRKAAKANGAKGGRPVDPNSARQRRLRGE